MPAILLVDTTVLLNVLNVPGFNQARGDVLKKLQNEMASPHVNLLLPMAAVFEAGNHIAHLADGRERRRYADAFSEQVRQALRGAAPWRPTELPDADTIQAWLDEFPDRAMQEIGLADLSIIKDWEAACTRHPRHRVTIWSLDRHLSGFDRAP